MASTPDSSTRSGAHYIKEGAFQAPYGIDIPPTPDEPSFLAHKPDRFGSDDKSGPLLLKHKDPQFLTNNPYEVVRAAANLAVAKANTPLSSLFVGGFMSGAYLGVAGLIMTIVAGGMHGPTGLNSTNPGLVTLIQGLVFPPGLILVVLSGSDLFTSNIFFFTAAFLEGKVKWHMVLRSWVWSWFSNLVGSLTLVYFAHWAGVLGAPTATNSVIAFAKTLSVNKTSYTWHGAVVRGIMCNWLVCMAIWQGMASTDVIGKIFGIYLPVAYFIIGGFEHCVANQYLLYQGLVAGADVSVSRTIAWNLVPSTLGCMVGGMCFVAFASWWAYGERQIPGRRRIEKYPL